MLSELIAALACLTVFLICLFAWQATSHRRNATFWRKMYGDQVKMSRRLMQRVLDLEVLDQTRKARHREIARLGGKAKAAKAVAETPQRRARTAEALSRTVLRPREEVVADVVAARAARKSQPAGVAAAS